MSSAQRPGGPHEVHFEATGEATGGTTTGIRVPETVLQQLGWGRRPKVAVNLAGRHAYRTTVGSHDGDAFLPVSAAVRQAAQIAAGDRIAVHLGVDDAPREVAVPDDLAAALREKPPAQTFFEGLTESQRKTFVLSVTSAKTPQTRARRVQAAADALEERRKRP